MIGERLLKLRPYQQECQVAVNEALFSGDFVDRAAVVLPTGSGKTVIFAWLGSDWSRDRRVTILVHRDELVQQTVSRFHEVAPDLAVGVVQGGVKITDRLVTVASVQTLSRPGNLELIDQLVFHPLHIGGPVVIVDECHHAVAASYRNVLERFGCFDGRAKAVGFTATLSRGDKQGLGSVWQSVCYRRDILDMITEGYLCDVKGKAVTVDGLTLAEAKMSGGDFQVGSLSDLMLRSDAASVVAEAYTEHGIRRLMGSTRVRPGIVFVPSLEAAQVFLTAFRAAGFNAEMVWGSQDRDERRRIVGMFRAGGDFAPEVLINCMVLTEGFDAPQAEVCVIARPTTSAALYVQMAGRVLRRLPDRPGEREKLAKQALILDVVGASQEHRLATLADLSSRRINDIKPGESLVQAAIRERAEGSPFLADYATGYRDMDLFSGSGAHWLRTRAGVWFLAVKDDVVFVWPDGPDRYKIGVRPLKAKGGRFVIEGLELDYARAWAEQEAYRIGAENPTRNGADLVSGNAPWRSTLASENHLDFARRLGITSPGRTKGAVSDAINVHLASAALDKHLPKGVRA
jgi:superfamily II DNA or RNA helicase